MELQHIVFRSCAKLAHSGNNQTITKKVIQSRVKSYTKNDTMHARDNANPNEDAYTGILNITKTSRVRLSQSN